jgi:hypothetical protein
MKKFLVLIPVVLISVVLIIFFLIGLDKSDTNIENYLNTGKQIDVCAKDVMPDLDNLPTYKDIDYKYTNRSMFIFESDAIVLLVTYDDETFKNEKAKLEEKYTFLNENSVKKTVIPECEFSINSYNFRVVDSNGKDNTFFPKSFGMIGTSDENNSIAYLYFYDFDLDAISLDDDDSPKMSEFVKNYFKYDF